MEKYEMVRDIGSGNFGVAKLMRNKETKELVAMKYIERGHRVINFSCLLLVNFLSFIGFVDPRFHLQFSYLCLPFLFAVFVGLGMLSALLRRNLNYLWLLWCGCPCDELMRLR